MPPKDLQHHSFLAQVGASSTVDGSYPGIVLTVKDLFSLPLYLLRCAISLHSAVGTTCALLACEHGMCDLKADIPSSVQSQTSDEEHVLQLSIHLLETSGSSLLSKFWQSLPSTLALPDHITPSKDAEAFLFWKPGAIPQAWSPSSGAHHLTRTCGNASTPFTFLDRTSVTFSGAEVVVPDVQLVQVAMLLSVKLR